MSEESSWAPAPRRNGRRMDWGSAPETPQPLGATGFEPERFGTPKHEAPRSSYEGLGDLFDERNDDLPGTLGWGEPSTEESNGLGDLFGGSEEVTASAAPTPEAPAVDLDGLFGDEDTVVVGQDSSGALDELFLTDTAPAVAPVSVPETPVADLDDLFADEFPANEVSAELSAADDTPTMEFAGATAASVVAPEAVQEPEEDVSAEAQPEAPEVPSSDVLDDVPAQGGSEDFWTSIPLPTETVASAPEPSKEDTPEPQAEVVDEVELPSLTSLAGLVQRTPAEVVPATDVPAAIQLADDVPDVVAAKPAESVEVHKPRFDIAARRQAMEEASVNSEFNHIALEQHALLQQYAVPDHIWSYVDRLLGYISYDAHVQSILNPFVLTRDRILDAEQRRTLEQVLAPRLPEANLVIQNPRDAEATFDMAYDELIGISVLGPLWRDEDITEIMVDGWDRVVVERKGRLVDTPLRFRDLQHAQRVARDLAAKISDRGLTPANPLVTAQLPGARVTFAYGSVVKSGLSISLRKFVDLLGMEKLLSYQALTPEMAEFLRQAVVARATVLVSGGTGTGKTTQINALSEFIPDNERVITIEDAFELQLSNTHVVSLQTKERASADDEVLITQDMLLTNTLRMRPDRVIVGEIREGNGAVVMLRAANTGHDGTMTTIHAQATDVALNERLADLVMEATSSPSEVVRRGVASAIDLVVQVTRKHGKRYISEISVVDRSCFKNGNIVPEPVFVGDVNQEGELTFSHVGGIRSDTALGTKFAEVGFDIAEWELTP